MLSDYGMTKWQTYLASPYNSLRGPGWGGPFARINELEIDKRKHLCDWPSLQNLRTGGVLEIAT